MENTRAAPPNSKLNQTRYTMLMRYAFQHSEVTENGLTKVIIRL